MAGTSSWKSIKFASSESDDDNDYDHGDPEIDFDLLLEKLNLGPKKKLLVLSLHGFLIYRTHIAGKSKIPKSRSPDGRFGNHLVYKRPYIDQFLNLCLERFEVGIWSSAMEFNVDGVLDCALDGLSVADDVRAYVKENNYGQPAITPQQPNWDFYSNVLRLLGKEKNSDD